MNDGGKRRGVRVENFQIKQEVASEPCQIKTRSFQMLRNRRCRLFLFWLSTFPLNIIAPILLRSARQNENQNPRRVVFPFFSFFFWATPEKDFFGGEEVLTRSVSSCQRLLSKQRLCEVRARTHAHLGTQSEFVFSPCDEQKYNTKSTCVSAPWAKGAEERRALA